VAGGYRCEDSVNAPNTRSFCASFSCEPMQPWSLRRRAQFRKLCCACQKTATFCMPTADVCCLAQVTTTDYCSLAN